MTPVPIRYQTVEVSQHGCTGYWTWRLRDSGGHVLRRSDDESVGWLSLGEALAAVREAFPQSNTSIRLRVWRDGVWVPEDWWK